MSDSQKPQKAQAQGVQQPTLSELYSRGWATPKELLTQSFGSWPPPGLQSSLPDIPISLRKSSRIPWAHAVAGFSPDFFREQDPASTHKGQSILFVNRNARFGRDATQDATLAHETTHILDDLNLYLDNRLESQTPRASNEEINSLKTAGRLDVGSDTKLYGAIQADVLGRVESSEKKQDRHTSNGPSAGRDNPLYYSEQTEEVARIAELMVNGVAKEKWTRMPETPAELHAAIYNSLPRGLAARQFPPSIMESKEFQAALKEFPVTPGNMHAQRAASDLVVGLGLGRTNPSTGLISYPSLKEEDKQAIWGKHLVGNYGRLLEMYGDYNAANKIFTQIGEKPKWSQVDREVAFAVIAENQGAVFDSKLEKLMPQASREAVTLAAKCSVDKARPDPQTLLLTLNTQHRESVVKSLDEWHADARVNRDPQQAKLHNYIDMAKAWPEGVKIGDRSQDWNLAAQSVTKEKAADFFVSALQNKQTEAASAVLASHGNQIVGDLQRSKQPAAQKALGVAVEYQREHQSHVVGNGKSSLGVENVDFGSSHSAFEAHNARGSVQSIVASR